VKLGAGSFSDLRLSLPVVGTGYKERVLVFLGTGLGYCSSLGRLGSRLVVFAFLDMKGELKDVGRHKMTIMTWRLMRTISCIPDWGAE
jgi:hypothetical protein